MEFLGVATIVVLLFVLMAHQSRTRSKRSEVLSELAAAHPDWDFDGRNLVGRVRGATVTLRTSAASYDQAWAVEVEPDTPWSAARVTAMEEESVGLQLRTGHPAFDASVAIVGDLRQVLPSLSAEARTAIQRAVDAGFQYDGRRWRYHNVQLTADPVLLQTALSLGCDLALQVQPVEAPDAALEHGLRHEPEPAARAALLRARLEGEAPLPADLAAELLAPRDWGSLLVARRMGDEGWLFDLAAQGIDLDTRWEAIEALWGATADHRRLSAALGAFVVDTPWSGTAIERLEAVGTVAEVPVLRQVADSWLNEHRTEALSAIEAIQARARGTVGQLSLAEHQPGRGGLSVAQEQATRSKAPEG